MKNKMRCGQHAMKASCGGQDALILGAPWSEGDAVTICNELTGVAARVCRFEAKRPPDGTEPCWALALEGWRSLARACDTPYRYRCPHGVPCACISLASSQEQDRAFIWMRACPDRADRSPPSAACPFPGCVARPDGFADDEFDLAVNLLSVMAGCVRHGATGSPAVRREKERLTAHHRKLARQVCRAVHTRCADAHLRLGTLAAENAVSVAYLCTLFTRAVGVPFRSYLQAWRMLKVRERLVEDRLSIKEIALQTGFNDPNRLRLAFKAATGLAPREWRETRLAKVMRMPV